MRATSGRWRLAGGLALGAVVLLGCGGADTPGPLPGPTPFELILAAMSGIHGT